MDTTTLQYREAERELVLWQYGTAGGFISRLFELIARADTNNRNKLSLAYPEIVDVYSRYEYEKGYWSSVKERVGLK